MGDEPDTQPRKLVAFVAHMEPKLLESANSEQEGKREGVARNKKGDKP